MFILTLKRINGSFWAFLQSMLWPPEAIPEPKEKWTPPAAQTKEQQQAIHKIAREY